VPGSIELVDPREQYARPPYESQKKIDMPGHTSQMSPTPDHGESSYQGSGKLTGLTAVITGADSGIGRAVSIAYAREGADVVVSYLSEDEDAEQTCELVKQAGTRAMKWKGDLRQESECESLILATCDEFQRIDVLINNAAYQATRDDLDEFSTDLFDRIMKTNLYAPFWLSRAALPKLPKGGSIINTVSIQGYEPSPELLPYSATKSALIGMTKGMAKLAIKHGVRVNAVAPGPVWTPLIPGSVAAEKVEHFGENTLFGRAAQPAELAPLYVWLASPHASYVTGEVFGATGGRTPV
jgi:NAD(P)-dependent dehydrogenase (short-subunit alcohol dehydrogenase family)